jgi:hypothetical protein
VLIPSQPQRGNPQSVAPRQKVTITFRILPDGKPFRLEGRPAWMLKELIIAGERGCTAMQYPGARLSHYIMLLRRDNIGIESVFESHGGQFPGAHCRYCLRSEVVIVDDAELAA